ncbi:MAG: Na+/H+ antiporter NhaC family protein [Clostridia bacterium]|nr:Na+/H+ antiporter NhaC family protein [Clostridia bacterium]
MKSKNSLKAIAVLGLVLVLLMFIRVDINATPEEVGDEAEEAVLAEEQTAFTLMIDDEEVSYDLSEDDSAFSYVDEYATNLQEDEDFESHISLALTKVRENIRSYATFYALLPPIIAILLALITKEVYSSLFIGILTGGLLYSNFSFEGTLTHVFSDGFIGSLSDSYNVGILIFLVLLGALVAMMNKAGGSTAFGKWAAGRFKTRVGAQVATIILGILIFIDDYFNCLTVGSVMRPVTDKQNISRAKLAYLIDATAAPICIIAPISSWAAAVAGFAKGAGAESGMSLFISAIPFNFYAILTITMMLYLAFSGFDFGLMKKHEDNAKNGDIFTSGKRNAEKSSIEVKNEKGRVFDLIVPIVVLIACCVVGMIYSGGFFDAESEMFHNFIGSFSESDASVGLVYGSFVTIIFAVIYFIARRVLSFKECMECFPEGFKAMVPAIMILTCAWTLKIMTDSLGAKIFISQLVEGSAAGFKFLLPAVIFVIACFLSFATGTSWGTFGILIPIVLSVFGETDGVITIIAVSACMAGAVCGDHCSPISDTTIMASAGAECDHLNHVSTQLPYAVLCAIVSFVCYIIASFIKTWYIMLPLAIVIMIVTLFVTQKICEAKYAKKAKKTKAKA